MPSSSAIVVAAAVEDIPTLSTWMLIALASLLGTIAVLKQRA